MDGGDVSGRDISWSDTNAVSEAWQFRQAQCVRWNVIIIPLLIVLGGIATAAVVPVDGRLRALIIGADCFAAVTVGLILLRAGQRR